MTRRRAVQAAVPRITYYRNDDDTVTVVVGRPYHRPNLEIEIVSVDGRPRPLAPGEELHLQGDQPRTISTAGWSLTVTPADIDGDNLPGDVIPT